jgi:hypothetical protein
MLIYVLFLLCFCFRPMSQWCKTYSDVKLCNNALCIVAYMWVHPVCYLNRVWQHVFRHLLPEPSTISHNSVHWKNIRRVRKLDDLTHVLQGSIPCLLHHDMARDHPLVRPFPCHHCQHNHRVQMTLRAVVVVPVARALKTTSKPSYRPMEPSPPQPTHFTVMVRSHDLGRFYGRTEGLTPCWQLVV